MKKIFVDYKNLCKIFKTKNGNIREADKEKLSTYLHVEPGHVNSFSLLNLSEEQKKEVQFHLDKNLVDKYKHIGIPPMNSSSTCWIRPDDLKKLLEKYGFTVNITDLNEVKEEDKKDDQKGEKIIILSKKDLMKYLNKIYKENQALIYLAIF